MIDTWQNKLELERESLQILAKLEERTNAFTEGKSQKQIVASVILNADILKNLHQLGISNPYLPILFYVRGECKEMNAKNEAIYSRTQL